MGGAPQPVPDLSRDGQREQEQNGLIPRPGAWKNARNMRHSQVQQPTTPLMGVNTMVVHDIANNELDFLGEGFAPPVPVEVEESCNATLKSIGRSVQRAAAYVDLEHGLDQVPERDDFSSDEDSAQGNRRGRRSGTMKPVKTAGGGGFLASLRRSSAKPASTSPSKSLTLNTRSKSPADTTATKARPQDSGAGRTLAPGAAAVWSFQGMTPLSKTSPEASASAKKPNEKLQKAVSKSKASPAKSPS